MSWGDGVMVALTGASVLVGGVALGHARRATAAAAKAALEAAEANRIAKEANGLAGRSNTIAQEANKIAAASNDIAREAADVARDAPLENLWDEFIVVLNRHVTFDSISDPQAVGPLLTETRTRAMLLADRMKWDEFARWVDVEHQLGTHLLHEVELRGAMLRHERQRDLTADEILDLTRTYHRWGVVFLTNVRFSREKGPGTSLETITAAAWHQLRLACERNGWPVPTGRVEGVEAVET